MVTGAGGAAPGPRPVTPVGILAALLDRIAGRADELPPDLAATARRAQALAGGLEPYLGVCTTPESAALAALAARTRAQDWAARRGPDVVTDLEQEMLSGHVEGQLLKFLVHMTRARRVLEVGLFTGYSALAMAEALPADGELVACEIDGQVAAFARDRFTESPDGHKISVMVGPAAATLDGLADAAERFDMVFLDADKGGYVDYLRIVLDRGLLAPGGLICADNTLLQGLPYLDATESANGAAMARFNETVAADPRVEQVLIPLRDGLTLIRRVS